MEPVLWLALIPHLHVTGTTGRHHLPADRPKGCYLPLCVCVLASPFKNWVVVISTNFPPFLSNGCDYTHSYLLSTPHCSHPSLFTHLTLSQKICYGRLQKRARPEEDTVSQSYLETLHERHEDWLIHKSIKWEQPVSYIRSSSLGNTMAEWCDCYADDSFLQLWVLFE